ncbi:pyridoxal-phosphate dependent enzyme [Isosphaeraceae bacterium EP7]
MATAPADLGPEDLPAIGPEAVEQAARRIADYVHRTPVLTGATLDRLCGGTVGLKCENFQKVGAFKFRGAVNALLQLGDAGRAYGVVTHSSGNHAQALACAGQILGVPVCVVMPHTAPEVKRAATRGYGGTVVSCEPTLADREATVARLVSQHGYEIVHPFDDWRVIAGQGTVALELLDQAGPLDLILSPVGGGGLLAGTALAVQGKSPDTLVIGVEPAAADDAKRSLAAGSILPSGDPKTIADGLRTSLGTRPWTIIRRHVHSIVSVGEPEIIDALRFVWERFKIVIEPSSAVTVAPLLAGTLDVKGQRVGVILGGGNVDLSPMFDALKARWL